MVIRYVEGMHGMGDNLHQRAIVRKWLAAGEEVWLDTPWPEIYHDLPVHCFSTGSRLRTQAKNIRRSGIDRAQRPSEYSQLVQVSYPQKLVRQCGSVMRAMAASVHGSAAAVYDFRFPVPAAWTHGVDVPPDRPLLVVRPLVKRREWGGAEQRNPDPVAYADVFELLRGDAFVVSVADIERGHEDIVSVLDADLYLHKGELDFKRLAALWRDADAVYTAPGFGVVLAQAVGTPVCAVFGGYEKSYSFSSGLDFSDCLFIDADVGCDCFSHHHACDKRITVMRWRDKIAAFRSRNLLQADR